MTDSSNILGAPVGEDAPLSDSVLIDCMAAAAGFHDSRALRIERTSIARPRGENEPYEYDDAWRVSGCGLGGAPATDLRAALSDHFRSLVRLADHDDWFEPYRESLTPIIGSSTSSSSGEGLGASGSEVPSSAASPGRSPE